MNTQNNVDDGGPAFPVTLDHRGCVGAYGMSLRDWFAGQALSGLCANSELFRNFAKMRPEMLKVMNAEECDSFDHKVISMCAKSIADAMIAARKTKNS